MLDNIPILSLITFSPLLGVLVLAFIPKDNGKWIRRVGLAATFIPLILSAWMYIDYSRSPGGTSYVEQAEWIVASLYEYSDVLSWFDSLRLKFTYTMAADGLSVPLVFLTALIACMAAFASTYIKKRWKTYYILFLLLETAMFGVFLAQDLFLFFVFFELTLVPTFFLIGIWGFNDREKAANKFLLYNGVGSAVMLIAFLIIIATAGFTQSGNSLYFSSHLGDISANLFSQSGESYATTPDEGSPFFLSEGMKWTLFILLLTAFGIKLPIFPFHTWMLKVHAEAPPSVVMIHAGILLKMGGYGLIRFGMLLFPEQAADWGTVLAVLGVINILYGAVLAFRQTDFKLVLAYSSISHMGIVLLGIAALNDMGIQGAVFQMVSHGLISALMFLLVGGLYERTETTELARLGGLARSMPFFCGVLMVAGLASLGLPGLSGFVGELAAFLGLFESNRPAAILGAIGIILAAAYVLRAILAISYGPVNPQLPDVRDARLTEVIPMIVLVAFIVLLGIYPSVVTQPMQQTIGEIHQFLATITTKVGG